MLARRLLLTGDIIEAGAVEHLGAFTDTCAPASVAARAWYWAGKAAKMPADGVVFAKEAFRLVEQGQAYQGEEVASYVFHAYGTNLQFMPGEFNFVRRALPRARAGVTAVTNWRQYSSCYFCNVAYIEPRSRTCPHPPLSVPQGQPSAGRSRGPGQYPSETLITTVLLPEDIDDIIFAESHYGGRDLARYAADATGLQHVPGQSVNRHCAGSLTAIGNAAAQIGSGMERVLIAGGVQSLSRRRMRRRRTCRSPSVGTPCRPLASPARRWTRGRRGRTRALSQPWTRATSSGRSFR
ncbi:hypothetical protein ACVWWN_006208 [Mycobacterium sp. URHB0021]